MTFAGGTECLSFAWLPRILPPHGLLGTLEAAQEALMYNASGCTGCSDRPVCH